MKKLSYIQIISVANIIAAAPLGKVEDKKSVIKVLHAMNSAAKDYEDYRELVLEKMANGKEATEALIEKQREVVEVDVPSISEDTIYQLSDNLTAGQLSALLNILVYGD